MEKATSPPFPMLLYLELTCFDERPDLTTHSAFSILPLQNGGQHSCDKEKTCNKKDEGQMEGFTSLRSVSAYAIESRHRCTMALGRKPVRPHVTAMVQS